MPKLLGNSKNFQEGFITLSAVFDGILFVLQASWRHANVVLEYSGKHTNNCYGFYENVRDLFIHIKEVFTPS